MKSQFKVPEWICVGIYAGHPLQSNPPLSVKSPVKSQPEKKLDFLKNDPINLMNYVVIGILNTEISLKYDNRN
jgi:hypothetical protein